MWWGKSLDVLSSFPDRVKMNLGYSLRLLQWGEEPMDYRPLPSVGKGLFELREYLLRVVTTPRPNHARTKMDGTG
jgi:phage-related protein